MTSEVLEEYQLTQESCQSDAKPCFQFVLSDIQVADLHRCKIWIEKNQCRNLNEHSKGNSISSIIMCSCVIPYLMSPALEFSLKPSSKLTLSCLDDSVKNENPLTAATGKIIIQRKKKKRNEYQPHFSSPLGNWLSCVVGYGE